MPKNTNNVKITDAEKSWNRKPKTSTYQVETIPIGKTILITCEGQTEKLYFESFPVLGVKAFDLGGQSKLKLVESTLEIVQNSKLEYNEVWCVFDMDVKRGEAEYSDFDNSIIQAKQLGFNVAYSNDSFELWFYLHYYYTDLQNLRGFYYEELGKKFGINYVREGKKYNFCLQLYKILSEDASSSQEKAIVWAKRLLESNKHLPFHQQNPVTTVYQLVEVLNENLRK